MGAGALRGCVEAGREAGPPPAFSSTELPEPLDPIDPSDGSAFLDLALDAAAEAGRMALAYFRPGETTSARITYKAGNSPVTEADLAVDAYLRDRLGTAVRGAAWLSEETADDLGRLDATDVLVIDPIDGTRAFLSGDRQWSVSIALVSHGRPIAGVVHAPALGLTFSAVQGGAARCNDALISVTARSTVEGASIAAPAGFAAPLVRRLKLDLVPKVPSLAYRLAKVAAGDIDAALASPDSHDWDIAAADLILHEAGGRLTGADGQPPSYNRRRPRHPTLYAAGPGIQAALVAAGRRTLGSGA